MYVASAVIQMYWKYRTAKTLDEIERKGGRPALINEIYKYKVAVDRRVRKESNS